MAGITSSTCEYEPDGFLPAQTEDDWAPESLAEDPESLAEGPDVCDEQGSSKGLTQTTEPEKNDLDMILDSGQPDATVINTDPDFPLYFSTMEGILDKINDPSTTQSEILQLFQDIPDLLTVITSGSVLIMYDAMKSRQWNQAIEYLNWFEPIEVNRFFEMVRKMEIALFLDKSNQVVDCLYDLNCIKDFPANFPISVSLHKGNTLLHLAVEHSFQNLTCRLLDKGANTDLLNDCGETPLNIACRTCIDVSCQHCGVLILHKVISCSNNCNILNSDGETGLHFLLKNFPSQVSALPDDLLGKFDMGIKDSNNDSALHLACKKDAYLMDRIIAYPNTLSCVFLTNNDGQALPDLLLEKYLVSREDAFTSFLEMIFQMPNFDNLWSPNDKQLQQIHSLFMSKDALQQEYFLSTCLKHPMISSYFFEKNKDLSSVFNNLIKSRNFFSLKILSQIPESNSWFKDNEQVAQMLLKALEEDDDQLFDALTQNRCCAVNFKFRNKKTLLHIACSMKNVPESNLLSLVSHPLSDPNLQDKNGDTPVHIACKTGKYSTVKLMSQHKPLDHTILNKSSNTSLMEVLLRCKNRGDIKAPTELIGVFPEIHSQDTILHVATRMTCAPKLFFSIKSSDSAYHSSNKDGDTPLLVALKTKQFDKAESLLNFHNLLGYTLVHHLCTTLLYDSLEALLQIPKYRDKELLKVDRKGNTALHIASSHNSVKSVQLIIDIDPSLAAVKNKSGETPLHLACQSRQLEIVDILLSSNIDVNITTITDDDGWLPLHSVAGDLKIVKKLLGKDPDPIKSLQIKNCDGETPFHIICRENSKLLQYLMENYQLKSLFVIQDKFGNTPLHLIMKQHTNQDIMESLDSVLQYIDEVPMIRNREGISVFHQCIKEQFDGPLSALLIKMQGRMPCGDICKLIKYALDLDPPHIDRVMMLLSFHIHDHPEGSRCDCLDSLECGLIHFAAKNNMLAMAQLLVNEFKVDPTRPLPSGNTPLHLACLSEGYEVAQFFLSTTRCDIHATNSAGKSPLEIASKSFPMLSLLNKFEDFSKCKTTYPIDSYCKVFVTGHSGAGKSTIVTVFKSFVTQTRAVTKVLNRFQKVSDVEPYTAGIIPWTLTGEGVGNVIIYDLAGHFEYHSSHAAILENLISSSSPLFIVVIDLSRALDEVKEQLQYWSNLLQSECSRLSNPSPVIVIGSHSDRARNKPDYSRKRHLPSQILTSENFPMLSLVGFICMDCRILWSAELNMLHRLFVQECKQLRQFSPKVNLFCHGLYAFLVRLPELAVTLGEVRKGLEEIEDIFIPTEWESLSEILTTLSDKGLLLFLKDEENLPKSWIILQKQVLLSEIHGRLFAPQHFQNSLMMESSTGLVPKSFLEESFPQYSINMIVTFLVHFELCQEFDKDIILQMRNENEEEENVLSEQLLFFPSLIKDDSTNQYWPPENTTGPNFRWFGWVLQCHNTTQKFFTYRFLHVLLLRLAFLYALPPSETSEADHTSINTQVIRRRCTIWKTGIRWLSRKGVWTMVHLTNGNRTLQLLMASPKTPNDLPIQNLSVVRYRSRVMGTVIETQREFCRNLTSNLHDIILDPSIALVPTSSSFYLTSCQSKKLVYNLPDITAAVLERQDPNDPCNIIDTVGSKSITLSDLLMFESYKGFDKDVLEELFSPEKQEKELRESESFISDLVECMSSLRNQFTPIKFATTVLMLEEKKVCELLLPVMQNTMEFDQYISVINAWIRLTPRPNYRNLRKCFDELSLFARRNPLVVSLPNGDLLNGGRSTSIVGPDGFT